MGRTYIFPETLTMNSVIHCNANWGSPAEGFDRTLQQIVTEMQSLTTFNALLITANSFPVVGAYYIFPFTLSDDPLYVLSGPWEECEHPVFVTNACGISGIAQSSYGYA